MRRLGIIGGTSWVSSEHYYREINTRVNERFGGSTSAPLLLWSVEFGEFAEMQHRGDWAGVGRVLADAGRHLAAAGCEGIALAANTTHLVAGDVRAAIGDVPLIDLVDLAAAAVSGHRKVGLLGTRFTMESNLFPDRLARDGVEVIIPDGPARERVHEVIYDELTRGVVSESARADYLDVIGKLAASGAEAVLLACTEQGMLLRDGDADVPLVDTTLVHCAALADFVAGDEPS